jgi:uncharacterized protein YdhG (YjbR/CyaY superfamily)
MVANLKHTEYLAALSDDKRAALETSKIIRAAVPKAEECISYQLPLPARRQSLWFGAAANHCAIYGAGRPPDELKDYDISKGTIRSPIRPCRLPSCGS